ncbi:MAG: DUF4974 domain-containing protein [Cytophagales bacterium]|nr:DUF4974 domain-containing protein [Cytophagales bacterium]
MKNKSVEIDDLLLDPSFIAYVQNSDPKAVVYWQNRIKEQPENSEMYTIAARMIKDLMVDISEEDVEEALMRLNHSVRITQQTTGLPKYQSPRGQRTRWYRYAAILVAFFTAAFILGFFISRHLHQPDLTAQNDAVRWVTKQTIRGQKSTITLKDGTRIRLNAESTLLVPKVFCDTLREVKLIGEAFFEVTRDPERPFLVHSNNTVTEVLGTSFNINAYPENSYTSIALVEGRISVNVGGTPPVILEPKEALKVSKNASGLKKERFDPEEITAWKDGIVRFQRAGFEEMVKVLERWYDVEFVVRTDPSVKAFSGEFNNESLEEVLKGISFSLDFNYRLEGKKVYIN